MVHTFTSGLITSRVPQASNLGPILFNVFICDLEEDMKDVFTQFAADMNQWHAVNVLKGRPIQGNINRLEKRIYGNLMKFNKNKKQSPKAGKR